MRRSEVLQENRKMRFEEAYEGWNEGRLSQFDALLTINGCKQFQVATPLDQPLDLA